MTNARRTRFARCSRCGREFRARARFCPHCGVAVKIDGGKVSVPAVEKDPEVETAAPSPPAMPLSVMAEIAATPPPPRQPLTRQPLTRQPLTRQPLTREPLTREPLTREPLTREIEAPPVAAPTVIPAAPVPAVPLAAPGQPVTPPASGGTRPPLLLAPLVLLLALMVFLFAWLANR